MECLGHLRTVRFLGSVPVLLLWLPLVGWLWGVGVVVDFRIVDASILAHASFVGVWVVLFFVL